MTQDLDDFFLSYKNGNYSWCRDEFWNASKLEMRFAMKRALNEFENNEDLARFIDVIFLP